MAYSTYCAEFSAIFRKPNGDKATRREVNNLMTYLHNENKALINLRARRCRSLEFSEAVSVATVGFIDGYIKYYTTAMYEGQIHFQRVISDYMRSALQKAHRDNRPIQIPHNHHTALDRAKREGLLLKDDSDLTAAEKQVKSDALEIMPLLSNASLDTPMEDGSSLGEVIPDLNANTIASILATERVKMLQKHIGSLPALERFCLENYHGMNGEQPKTLREIAVALNSKWKEEQVDKSISHTAVGNRVNRAVKLITDSIMDSENIAMYDLR